MRYRVRSEARAALLGDDEIVIGRSTYCTLLVGHSSVSRVHARVRLVGEDVVVEDAKSRNGTFVNGARITGPTIVRAGDRIDVGRVRVELELVPDHPISETNDRLERAAVLSTLREER